MPTDYMISGRIDNFRGTNGVALGADTGDMPNPQGRGENDWVVELNAFDFGDTTDGGIGATGTTGSADGVPWDRGVERSALRADHGGWRSCRPERCGRAVLG